VFKGTVFEVLDQSVDFVLARLSFAVGIRAVSTQVPAAYEIPPEVIREAIVNAIAHRDYTSNGSVQGLVFADRVEVWTPGHLPPSLTLAQLRQPHGSIPANPLLAEPGFALDDGFRIRLGRPPAEISSIVTTEETKEETQEEAGGRVISGTMARAGTAREQILAQIRANPEITIAELARLLNLSESGVEYNLRKLRKDSRIAREGSTKAGRWLVRASPPGSCNHAPQCLEV
jgi:predicted HTH transcriptional regulator